MPESRDEAAHRSFDVAGAVTVTGGLMTLVYAIVEAEEQGWGSATTIVDVRRRGRRCSSASSSIELRAKAPLVRLSIFRIRSLSAANVVMFLVASGLFAMFFFNSLYIQRVLGYGPLKAGLAFLPFTAGIMVSAGLASALRAEARRAPGRDRSGWSSTAAGLLLLTQIPVDGSYVSRTCCRRSCSTSLGMGAVFVPLTLVATTGLEDEDQGLASGLFNTSQQIGGALGLAVLSTLAASHTQRTARKPQTLVDGFHWAFAGSAVFVLAGLVALVTLLRQRDVEQIEQQAEDGATATVAA